MDHRLREHRCSRRTVTSDVVGLGRNFLGELRAEVFVWIFEFDLTSDSHTIVRDRG